MLAVIGTSLPSALRAFLLTLAVVDDLFAILIIAVFFTDDASTSPRSAAPSPASPSSGCCCARAYAAGTSTSRSRWSSGALMYNSGVHATIAGVAMGLMLRCTTREGEEHSPGEHIEHLVRPLSAGLAVPLFALFSAGVSVSGGALGDVFTQPETLGVVLGLVVGKTRRHLRRHLAAPPASPGPSSTRPGLADVFAVASLAGIGFTVSLLIGELAFDGDPVLTDEVKAAVLIGSLIAAVLAGVLLKLRNTSTGAVRGRGARRGPGRHPRHLRAGRPGVPPADGRDLRAEGRGTPPARRTGGPRRAADDSPA